MKRISSLAALLAFLALGALLTFTHSESAGQTQLPNAGKDPDAELKKAKKLIDALTKSTLGLNQELIDQGKMIQMLIEEHEDNVKALKRKIKVLEAELKETRALDRLAEAHSEIAVLKRLPKVTSTPAERAQVLEQLRARLDKIDRELDEMGREGLPVLERPGAEEKKDDGEPAKEQGRPAVGKKQLERHHRYIVLLAERQRTMNFLLDALAVGPVTDQNAGIMMMLKTVIETKGLQEKVKLKTALEYFSDQFNGKLPILVDDSAFNPQNDTDVPSLYEEEVSLPPVPRAMPMSLALRIILSQVGKGEATYQIRQGHIEITTLKNATAASTLTNATVTASFDLRPLHEVLDALTEQSGLDINVDPAVGKKAATPIKATFRNTTLEEALVTATEMAELKYVVLDRTVFVTTPEKAEVLRKEQKERDQRREKMRPVNPGGRKRGELPA